MFTKKIGWHVKGIFRLKKAKILYTMKLALNKILLYISFDFRKSFYINLSTSCGWLSNVKIDWKYVDWPKMLGKTYHIVLIHIMAHAFMDFIVFTFHLLFKTIMASTSTFWKWSISLKKCFHISVSLKWQFFNL